MASQTALILSGGGARGAYQVGVLKGLAEILKKEKVKDPFQILSGVSAGALNSAKLATEIENFDVAVEKLIHLWAQMTTEQVFKTDFLSLNKFSLGLLGKQKLNAVLDTSPLRNLIQQNCDFTKIQKNLDKKVLDSLIITANNYDLNSAVSFIQTNKKDVAWDESRRHAELCNINSGHVMGSCAIPMLFPPIAINDNFFGDGCVRNNTPCSPAIRMGATKLFVIGVRSQMNSETMPTKKPLQPSLIRILNTLLNAVLLDSVEQDVLRIQRINELVELASSAAKQKNNLRRIEAICISPSQDIGEIARQQAHYLPRLLRMTISTFGHLDEASEILSYLLFNPQFCRRLIDMGYEDAKSSKSAIHKFFEIG